MGPDHRQPTLRLPRTPRDQELRALRVESEDGAKLKPPEEQRVKRKIRGTVSEMLDAPSRRPCTRHPVLASPQSPLRWSGSSEHAELQR
ncbi:hypothetical protein MRX96_029949 [Rhipicephalus microplus]